MAESGGTRAPGRPVWPYDPRLAMLDDAQKELLMRLFAAGSELPAAERAAFVAARCGDAAVQRELAELLQVEATGLAGFLALPAVAPPTADVAAAFAAGEAQRPPPQPEIDGYADFEHLAEGGMGTVYKARQLRPVCREVAIKLIRAGMDSDSVMARFAAERQALARMSHPYVAAVYDAGTDALGRPFLAMEFVDGVPITDYCTRERLSLADRLRLFVKVCRAVDHAHRRGVLHRDLKPSNVLVARNGDEVMPKVIDFGIAKALEGPLGEQSIHTLAGTFLGTPEYMAPEQIDGAVHQVDTRSDVYSLGVVLYELLTQARPIEAADVESRSVVQFSRLVRDAVPQRPSTRQKQRPKGRDDRSPDGGDRTRWARQLEGDLDWIVMKTLEKEPDRRYGSPRELAEDVENFLRHRPVSAGPPSGLYLLRKFARRYRAQVAAGALVLLSLVLGLSGTLWFLVESRANEADAVARAREAEGVRIAAEAALLAEENPNLALLLAIAAGDHTGDSAVRRTIYEALPQHALLRRLEGHDEGVEQGAGVLLQYLRDGRLVDSGSSDAVLWDPETGAQLRRFAGPRQSVSHMAIDPAERFLLATSQDGRAYLWEIETGTSVRILADHGDALSSCAFSPDGRLFATASRDGTARVFATEGAREPVVLDHGVPVGAVAFAADGTHLATFAEDLRTRLWNVRTGQLDRVLEPRSPVLERVPDSVPGGELFLAPRIDRIASSIHGTIRIHTSSGEPVAEVNAIFPRRLGDDRLLVSFAIEGILGIIDLRTGAVERHRALRLWSATPTPDGRHAIAIDHKLDVCLLDLSTMRVVRHFLGPADKDWRPPIAFHPDGTRFAVLGPDVRIWNLEPEFAPLALPGIAPWADPAAGNLACGRAPVAVVRPEGSGLEEGRWHAWDAGARRRLGEIHRPDLTFVVPSPCGTRLLGGVPEHDGRGWTVVVFDLGGRVQREIDLPAGPRFAPGVQNVLHWCADDSGRYLLTTNNPVGRAPAPRAGVMLQCHDLDTGALLAAIPHPGGVPVHVGGPQSASVVMAGQHLRTFTVVDWRTGAVRARVSRPADGMHLGGAISPDGRYLLGTLGEPLAFVWDLDRQGDDLSSSPIATYSGLSPAGAYPCGFASGGRLCWVVCDDEVHVFESATGRVFAVLRPGDTCTGIADSPDGAEILTLTVAGRVRRWPLDPLTVAQHRVVGRLDAKELAQYRIGTPAQRVAAERAWLRTNISPGNHARLGQLALADGDLDEAIACYQRGAALGVLGPYYEYLYRELLGLYCRRLATPGGTAEQRDADRTGAVAALELALACGTTPTAVLALPGVEALRDLAGFVALVGK